MHNTVLDLCMKMDKVLEQILKKQRGGMKNSKTKF